MRQESRWLLVIALVIVGLVGIAAAEKDNHKIELNKAGTVGAMTLESGPYMVSWEKDGEYMKVKFRRIDVGEVATAKARKVDFKGSGHGAEVIYGKPPEVGAVPPIKEIRFHDKNFALEFE